MGMKGTSKYRISPISESTSEADESSFVGDGKECAANRHIEVEVSSSGQSVNAWFFW